MANKFNIESLGMGIVYDNLESIIPGGIFWFHLPDKKLVYASEGIYSLTGYDKNVFDFATSNWQYDIIHPDDLERVITETTRQWATSGEIEIDYRIRRVDGTYIWGRLLSSCIKSINGSDYVQCLFLDDEKRKQATIDLLAIKRELDTLIHIIPGGVAQIILNENFEILLASDGFYNMTGYSKEECHSAPINGNAVNFILEEDIDSIRNLISEALINNTSIRAEYRIKRKDGTITWNTAYTSNIVKLNDVYIIEGVFIDTTDTKNMENRLLSLTNNISGGLIHLTIADDVSVMYANDGFYQLIGYSKEEFMSDPMKGRASILIHPDDHTRFFKSITEFMNSTNHELTLEYRILRKDKSVRWHRSTGVKLLTDPTSSNLECMIMDITDSIQTQKMLALAEERYRIITNHTQDIIFDWDMVNSTIFHSPVFEQKFGYMIPADKSFDYLFSHNSIHEDDIINFQQTVSKLTQGEPFVETQYRIQKADGDYLWCRIRATTIKDSDGRPYRAVGVITDIENYMKETAYLKEQAQTDLLTGLLNKITTEELIEDRIKHTPDGHYHAMYLIDIDNFKGINDNLGHLLGDAILKEISSQIKKQFRGNDIIGRVGGDEFLVLMDDISSIDIIKQKAEVLSNIFRHSFHGQNTGYQISGSIGIAIFPCNGLNFHELFNKADLALYHSKGKGKDCYSFYSNTETPEMNYMIIPPVDSEAEEKAYSIDFNQLIYDVLYNTQDVTTSVNIILDLAARYYRMDYIYIYQKDMVTDQYTKTFEYCNDNTKPLKESFIIGNDNKMDDYWTLCDEEGTFLYNDINQLPKDWQDYFNEYDINSIVQIPIMNYNDCYGFIGFGKIKKYLSWDPDEVEAILILAKIICSILITNQLKKEVEVEPEVEVLPKFINQLIATHRKELQYIVDDQFILYYHNGHMQEFNNKTTITCYKKLYSLDNPCPNCPFIHSVQDKKEHTFPVFNSTNQTWSETTSSPIQWEDGSTKYMISSFDITKYK